MKPFEETHLGGIPLRNRFVMAPMTTYSGNPNLTPSDSEIHYLKLRAHGPSMIISPAIAVSESAQAFVNQMSLMDDTKIAPMKKLVDAIRGRGGIPIAQLHHGGRMNDPSCHEDPERTIVAPSAIKAPRDTKVTPREMTKEEIAQTVRDFAEAARRAIEAGYQGIELHGANTYLLQQFFSPHSNRRTDEYGGSFEKRMRFIKEVISATHEVVKTHAPEAFIFGYRFSPEEIEEDGITMEMTQKLIAFLKEQAFDYLHVSLRAFDQTSMRNEDDATPLVDKIQTVLTHAVPLIGAGGINSLEKAKKALSMGFEYLGIGFPILIDPDCIARLEKGDAPSKEIDGSTLPGPLYERLRTSYRSRLEKDGYTFKLSKDGA